MAYGVAVVDKTALLATVLATARPRLASALIGSTGEDVVEVAFTRAVRSPGADYGLGVAITVAGAPATISGSARQADLRYVYHTLAAAGGIADAVTWAFAAATGDLESLDDAEMRNQAATTVTNAIGSAWRFNSAENGAQHGAVI